MGKYMYPAIFTKEDDGKYSIDFPDIQGCYTCGDDLKDGFEMAYDALSLMMTQIEDEGKEIPRPSSIGELTIRQDEFANYIFCDTVRYRSFLNPSQAVG